MKIWLRDKFVDISQNVRVAAEAWEADGANDISYINLMKAQNDIQIMIQACESELNSKRSR